MRYSLPEYIINAKINSPSVDYNWNDNDDLGTILTDNEYADEIISTIKPISLRAKIALSIGVYEWILGRFDGFIQEIEAYWIAEAAWCVNIDKHYANYRELYKDDYSGKIERALWYAFSSLIPMLYVSENVTKPESADMYKDIYPYCKNQWSFGLSFLIPLTLHVLPQNKVVLFKKWIEGCGIRLLRFHSMPEAAPFSNLFGHDKEKDWLGDYISREVLDLERIYDPNDNMKLCDDYLQSIDYRNNPLLTPIEELKKRIKNPYQLLVE